MNESHNQEQAWQAQKERDTEHKMFALHSQNERLREQQQQSEMAIHDYIRKVDLFNSKSLTIEQENWKLKKQVDTLNAANKKIEGLLNKRNEDYCSLYNYLFTEKKGSIQDVFFKEMDLNNRLSEIQHQSDGQIIEKLRAAVKGKNQELLKYAQRNNELSQALISSSYDYQQQINALKYQKLRLEEQLALATVQPIQQSPNHYFATIKIEGLRKELQLYKQQLLANTSELDYLRNVSSQLEKINTLRQNELQAIKSHLPHLNLNIFDILEENKLLREACQNEREKYQILIQGMPQAYEKITTLVDAEQKIAHERKQLKKLKGQIVIKNDQIKFISRENERMKKQIQELQLKYSSLQIVSTSSFSKLKTLIEAYIPYYLRKDGFDNYSLTEEEANFIAQRNVQATLLQMKKELTKKITENSHLKRENSQLQKLVLTQKEKISQFEQDTVERQLQIKKLEESTKSLLQKYSYHSNTTFNAHQEHYEDSQQHYQEHSPHFDYKNSSHHKQDQIPQHEYAPKKQQKECGYEKQAVEQVCEKKRIQVLEAAIEELQADRNELINIIREKDVSLIKLSAQIKVLKSIENASIHTSFKGQSPQLCKFNQEITISQQGEIEQVRSQLRHLSNQYRMESELARREYEQRQKGLRDKYMNLLKAYDQLSMKCNALESATRHKQVIQNSQQHSNELVNEGEQQMGQGNEIVLEAGQEQSIISQTAIQNFTDVLKKYQKEFSKYVLVYENQIKKSLQASVQRGQIAQQTIYSQEYVQRLQSVIAQHEEAITSLQKALSQKEQQSLIRLNQLEDQLKGHKQTADQLSTRLQEQGKLVSDLQQHVLMQKANLEFASAQSANAAFATLDLKNKEIEALKHNNEKLKQSYEDRCKEIAKMKQLSVVHSQIEAEEYKLLKDIIERQDLVGVLQGVVERLQ